ncbi:MAG TPA: cytochrome c [Roseiarcus sp.]|jgi:mono/diheme cytochrome c family protein
MKRRLTPGRVVAGLIGLGVVGVGGAWLIAVLFGGIGGDRSAKLVQPIDQKLIARGAYVAVLGDCSACHTAPGGKAYAGDLPIATPIGAVYTSNITPDEQTGIGRYSYGDFERAVRRGLRPDGSALYPAMPFPSYARMTDADVQALYAYFTRGVQPVAQANRRSDIPWPLSMRWPLSYWRWLFAPTPASTSPASETTDAGADALLARGAYLVEGPAHCGACHTPRGLGLQEKALTAQDGAAYLSGGVVNNFVASDLRGDAVTGLGGWSEDDIVEFLRTGRNHNDAAFGGMTDVVSHSTQFMTNEDLRAIAQFLKSLPGEQGEARFAYKPAAATALAAGVVSTRGALDYLNSCAACHRSTGLGYAETFPALAGNPVVNDADPSSLINIVLNGGSMARTAKAPTRFTMPPFADRLSDQEVADIVTFIRSSWGNNASAVDAAQVAKLRQALNAPPPAAER